jgi:3-hydroxyisobutyrate dehydrogenase-like beta-hydroxyacid dehydrogenase
MGLPMARHLAAAGFGVWGCDLDAERGAALARAGGRVAVTPGAAAAATDATLVMVADEDQVRRVVLGSEGVIAGARPDHILIIGSTMGPDACTRVARDARGHGLRMLDAPVCKGQRGAEAGTLTVLVGGTRALFEHCRPIFKAFSEHVFHVGESVGDGQTAKLVNNLMLWTGVVGAHAALTLAQRLGLSPVRLRAALQASSAESWALRELDRIQLTWPEKDLAQIAAAMDAVGASLPIVGPVRETLRRLTREDLRRLCSETDGPTTDQT